MTIGPFTAPGPHLDDEQLSLVVDGLADRETLAHTAACPDCGARLAQWRRVRDVVASPPATAPADRRDAAITAALGVFDTRAEPSDPPEQPDQPDQAEPAEVIELTKASRHQNWRSRPVAAVAAAAAALLLIVGLGIGLSHTGNDHTSASSSRSAPVTATAAAGGSASGSKASSAAAPAPASPALGSFPDMAALLPALRSATGEVPAAAAASGTPGTSRAPRCQAVASAAAGVAPATVPELAATLTYAGTPAVVYVYPAPASHVAVVLGTASCRFLARSSF
jgi:hypothetical protein